MHRKSTKAKVKHFYITASPAKLILGVITGRPLLFRAEAFFCVMRCYVRCPDACCFCYIRLFSLYIFFLFCCCGGGGGGGIVPLIVLCWSDFVFPRCVASVGLGALGVPPTVEKDGWHCPTAVEVPHIFTVLFHGVVLRVLL